MHHIVSILQQDVSSGGFGRTTVDGVMLLQRRGISTTREYGNKEHGFYVVDRRDERISVHFGDRHHGKEERFVRFFGEDKLLEAQAEIKLVTGADLRFGESTLAYCYASLGAAGVEQDDVFLSPLRYEPGSDTIRHVPTNYCVVAFEDGLFSKPVLDVDAAASALRPAVEEAFKRGFHPCDTRYGDDYCKRRLAWLAGSYVITRHTGASLDAQVLKRDMSTPTRLS